MGQTPSNPTISTPSITRYSPKYHIVETKQDPHYGEVKIIVEDETNEKQLLKEISFSSQEAFDRELDYFTQRVEVSHPNIASILGFSSENENKALSHSFTIKIFIEMLEKDLNQELQERIQTKSFFSENELLFICENIISALYHLETKGFSHGDLRPFNIFASSKGYKLFDPSLSSMKEQNAFVNAVQNGLQVFLSPELLAQVPLKEQAISYNKFKADVFSLGVTMLSLASLTHGEDLYDYESGQIDVKLLHERLASVKSHYSAFTCDLIRDMLIEDETKRPDFKSLHTKLLPYQDNIHQKIDLPFFKNKGGLTLNPRFEEKNVTGSELNREEKPLKAGNDMKQGPIEGPTREFDYQYVRLVEKENVKMGGQYKNAEDNLTKKSKKSRNRQNRRKNKQAAAAKQEELPIREEELPAKEEEEPIKTGGILIDPEDVLPSQREKLHIDPQTGETYANLQSWRQIKQERGRIVHVAESPEAERLQGQIEEPGLGEPQEIRELEVEHTRPDADEEPLKTGGILIRPEDALPSEREHLHADPKTGEAYVLLKTGTEIKEEQGGIVHAPKQQEAEDLRLTEPRGTETREFEYEFSRETAQEDPLKTGGIVIRPEDALPSERGHLHADPKTGEAYVALKTASQIREEQGGIVHGSGLHEIGREQGDLQDGEMQGFRTREFNYEFSQSGTEEDPLKTGGIVIRPEDALPSERGHLHADSQTGEASVALKAASQIREQEGIVHALGAEKAERDYRAEEAECSRFESRARMANYEFVRVNADEDPLKTGGIIIRPEDALTSERDHLHADPRTGEAYVMLKSGTQLTEEHAGIVHSSASEIRAIKEEERRAQAPLGDRFDFIPISSDQDTSQVYSRQFMYEFSRNVAEEDPVKTGGIVIHPDDALASHRFDIQTNPQTHLSFVQLKPWNKILREQGGIVHQPPVQARATSDQFKRRRESRRGEDHLISRERGENEPVKIGGILIDREDMLPSRREELEQQEVGRNPIDRSHYEILRGSDETKLVPENEPEYRPWKPVQQQHMRIVQPTRFMLPEDMLSWSSIAPQTREQGREINISRQNEAEPQKIGGIVISPEDMLPARREELRDQSDMIQLRPIVPEGQMVSRSSFYEYSRPAVEEEPIKTGGIVIHPDDALGWRRADIHTDPVTRISYATLKPWVQIREEQNGIVHNPNIHRRNPAKKERRREKLAEREPQEIRETEYDYLRERENEPIKGGVKSRARQIEVAEDKENVSYVVNYDKPKREFGDFSKSQGAGFMPQFNGFDERTKLATSFVIERYSGKQVEEDHNRLVELDHRLDNMLRRSRVILGESNVTNNLTNLI